MITLTLGSTSGNGYFPRKGGRALRTRLATLCMTALVHPLAAESALAGQERSREPLDIGSRLELFVDDYLVERLGGRAEQRLHRPARQGVAMVTDRPWEGNASHWRTVFRDGDRYRMYYMGGHFELEAERMISYPHGPFLCYAGSALQGPGLRKSWRLEGRAPRTLRSSVG